LIDGTRDNFQGDRDKEKWSESYNTAKYIFVGYMDIKKFDEAKKWLEKMTEINNACQS
jgi:hypothetical protein